MEIRIHMFCFVVYNWIFLNMCWFIRHVHFCQFELCWRTPRTPPFGSRWWPFYKDIRKYRINLPITKTPNDVHQLGTNHIRCKSYPMSILIFPAIKSPCFPSFPRCLTNPSFRRCSLRLPAASPRTFLAAAPSWGPEPSKVVRNSVRPHCDLTSMGISDS